MDHGRRFQFVAQFSVWLVSVVVFWKKQTLKIAFFLLDLWFLESKKPVPKSPIQQDLSLQWVLPFYRMRKLSPLICRSTTLHYSP